MFLSENAKKRILERFFEKTGFDLTNKHNLELINKQIKQIHNEINKGLTMKIIAEQEKYYEKYKIRCHKQAELKKNTNTTNSLLVMFSNLCNLQK